MEEFTDMKNEVVNEENPKYKGNLILDITLEFSLETIKYIENLEEKRKYVISRQLLKSATSIGANIREAQNAESKADFVHKMKIALKEVDETDYWLLLCEKASSFPTPVGLPEKLTTIRKILTKIVSTAKRNESP